MDGLSFFESLGSFGTLFDSLDRRSVARSLLSFFEVGHRGRYPTGSVSGELPAHGSWFNSRLGILSVNLTHLLELLNHLGPLLPDR